MVRSKESYAIECVGLVKVYEGTPPVEAVRGIDLRVPPGICFGLLGPNGAGKTTTLEILEGLLEPTAGVVRVLGQSWRRGNVALRRRIGVSLQETRLSERLTPRETLRLFRSFYGCGPTAEELLNLVGLEEKADAYVRHLSGGQKQRLAVACALVGEPELIFLDEPTTGLDPHSRRQLWSIIAELRQQGRTVVLSTHYMEEAERLCDQIAIIDRGRVIAEGAPAELIARLGGDHVIEIAADDSLPARLDELDRLSSVRCARQFQNIVQLTVTDPQEALEELLGYLRRHGIEVHTLRARHASLEDVFLSLTGRRLEESQP